MDLDQYIRKIPHFPKPGILFYDITTIFLSPDAYRYCIDGISEAVRGRHIDAVAAIESRGFLFAAPFALQNRLPLVLIRKKGKLPGKTICEEYALEYGSASLELDTDELKPGSEVLLIDDLAATGGSLNASRRLIERNGSRAAAVFAVIGLPHLGYEKALEPAEVHTLIQYHSESAD
jgi:adenine phosphoribosyltransferase